MVKPKGCLICIGGAEEKIVSHAEQERNNSHAVKYGILGNVVKLMRGNSPTVEVITTASSVPDQYYAHYKTAFETAGCNSVGHLCISSGNEAAHPEIIRRIEAADGIMFTGGDQLRLFDKLKDSPVVNILKRKYCEERFVIAGSSAGAAAMSNTMICGGNPVRGFIKGEIRMNMGFGFFENVIIDTHFEKRGRFSRLAQAVATSNSSLGLGLSEDTGVIVSEGKKLTAIGSGNVIIIEGSRIAHNNIRRLQMGEPISVSDLTVHIMASGDKYDIEKGSFIPAMLPAAAV
jgi:cyanophycinase